MTMKLDIYGYLSLTLDQRAEVGAWLTANDLEPHDVRCYEVIGDGEVLITLLDVDHTGRWYVSDDGEVAERQFAITPTSLPPHYNPSR